MNHEQFLIQITHKSKPDNNAGFTKSSTETPLSKNADLKSSASNRVKDDNKRPAEQREHRLEQQRQRRQQETKKATATRNMYRGIDKILENTYSAFETDEERENRLPTLQENVAKRPMTRTNAYSLQSKMKIRREVLTLWYN